MAKTKRFSGEIFGRYVLIERDFSQKHPVKWFCKCGCGNIKSVQVQNLKSGSIVSCGCFHKEKSSKIHKNRTLIDLSGQKFNRLFVIERNLNKKHPVEWFCKCDCGNITSVQSHGLKSGTSKSCGCFKKESMSKIAIKHDKSLSSIYKIWTSAKGRCLNPKNKSYHRYGARGITISKDWMNFDNFYRDMGDHPEGFSLDRIDNDKGYSKENCRWATPKEQSSNTCKNLKLIYENKEYNLWDLYEKFSKPLNILYSVVWRRIKRGVPLEIALKTKGKIK